MNKKKLLSGPYFVWMILFTIIPLLVIAWYGFTDRTGAFTLANVKAIASPEHLKALGLSLSLSIACTILCLLIAYPLAMILKKTGMGKKGFVVFIFILPMWMNFLLRTLAWQNLLEKNGVLNNILHFFHLPSLTIINTPYAIILGMVYNFLPFLHLPTLKIINTPYAIILGMIYNFLPFMVLPLFNVLTKIDENVLNAARDLGANSVQVFFKVTLPLSLPGIISGITMVFVPSLTTFAISDLLGARKIMLIGNIIEQEFSTADNWNLGSGLSLVLMVFILISMAVLEHYDKNGEGTSF